MFSTIQKYFSKYSQFGPVFGTVLYYGWIPFVLMIAYLEGEGKFAVWQLLLPIPRLDYGDSKEISGIQHPLESKSL